MSEPVKTIEIEDVLSSIRRLLSDGDPQPGGRGAGQIGSRPSGKPVVPARMVPTTRNRASAPLMLTPALRVATDRSGFDDDDYDHDDPEHDVDIDVDPVEAAQPGDPISATLAVLARDEEPSEIDFETEAARARRIFETADGFEFSRLPEAETTAAPKPDVAIDFEADPDEVLPTTPANGARSRLAATIAELESAITRQPDTWEPDGSEDAPVMDWAGTRAEEAAFLSRRSGVLRLDQKADDAELVDEAATDDADRSEGLDWDLHDPDAPADDAIEGRDELAEDAPAAEFRSERGKDLEQVGQQLTETTYDAVQGAAPQLDEDQLRAMITEIVRSELQGALGERITRNVRKLVRREIYRALSSSEFD